MKNIVVNIVRGRGAGRGGGARRVPRVSRGFLGNEALTSTRAQILAWERSWAALGVCVATQNVSGELLEALWRRFGTSWGALGALFGSIFGVKSSSLQFQIEKCTRSVFQLDEVYKACCFKPHLNRSW